MFRNRRILFFIILLIAVSSRFFYLDKGYNSDEGWLLKTAGLDLNRLLPFLAEGRSVYPPLSPFLLHLWIKLNDSEVWVRSYFVFFGLALCILVYIIGKAYLDKRFGLIAFFICAISPLLIWSSQFVRSYIDSAFWAILSTYFMLRIVKGGNFWRNSLGYIFSGACALYSSYLNVLILISQAVFILIFYFRDLKFLRRWVVLQALVIIIFLPCLPLMLKQLKLATAIDPKWGERGFQLLGLNLGYHARSIIATLGMDPGFLWTYPLAQRFNKYVLVAFAGLVFFIAGWFFTSALKNFRGCFKDNRITWFFVVISVSALLLYDILVETMNFPFQPEYFVTQHVLFIFVLSSVIYSMKRRKGFGIFTLAVISLIFILRFNEAVKPEFETKKAHTYLTKSLKATDCLLMVRNTNLYIDPKAFNVVTLYEYFHKDSDADYYKPLNEEARAALNGIKARYETVWFYRLHGNDEILGANRLIMDWLRSNGYEVEGIQKFRRIDVVRYERID
ncbi:MAG: glycosyltransferase family 39 protein [Candidatus Omnitrophota bacterium]|nr:glycosyltransferase family 39 protein [Candidatus Omnitrophota bacterium]